MEKVQLKRQGVGQTLRAVLPSGEHITIMYHHGKGCWGLNRYGIEVPKGPRTYDVWTMLPKATGLEEAKIAAGNVLGVAFEDEVEAYCYAGEATLRAYPRIKNDVFLACATYEPGTDTIRHEPSNVCLIVFSEGNHPWGHAELYPDDRANLKYSDAVIKACDSYNSNVKAHGLGVERKEWLAWLVSEYIKEMPGQKPKKVRHINREGDA